MSKDSTARAMHDRIQFINHQGKQILFVDSYENEFVLVYSEMGEAHHINADAADDPAKVKLYLDESGGDDPNTPHAVVGGVLINHSYFLHFEEAWGRMLEEHGILPPFHMREFGRHGRFADMPDRSRHELFLEVSELVNSHKIFSIAATLSVCVRSGVSYGRAVLCERSRLARWPGNPDHRRNSTARYLLGARGQNHLGEFLIFLKILVKLQRILPLRVRSPIFSSVRKIIGSFQPT